MAFKVKKKNLGVMTVISKLTMVKMAFNIKYLELKRACSKYGSCSEFGPIASWGMKWQVGEDWGNFVNRGLRGFP